jgi:tRNA(fMet)-specific endonuclease VapC
VVVTVITAEEQLRGWYTAIRKARSIDKKARAYQGLFEVIDTLKRMQVLPFTPAAISRFVELRKSYPRVGASDLAIAAIALDCGGIVVTRNQRDFGKIAGLQIDDWSKPPPAAPT